MVAHNTPIVPTYPAELTLASEVLAHARRCEGSASSRAMYRLAEDLYGAGVTAAHMDTHVAAPAGLRPSPTTANLLRALDVSCLRRAQNNSRAAEELMGGLQERVPPLTSEIQIATALLPGFQIDPRKCAVAVQIASLVPDSAGADATATADSSPPPSTPTPPPPRTQPPTSAARDSKHVRYDKKARVAFSISDVDLNLLQADVDAGSGGRFNYVGRELKAAAVELGLSSCTNAKRSLSVLRSEVLSSLRAARL